MAEKERVNRIMDLVRSELKSRGANYALIVLTSEGYIKWCEGQGLTIDDLKPEWQV